MSTWTIYSGIGVWFVMIGALMGLAAFAGVPVTIGESAVALLVGLMPPAMMLKLRVQAEPQGCVVPHLAGEAR